MPDKPQQPVNALNPDRPVSPFALIAAFLVLAGGFAAWWFWPVGRTSAQDAQSSAEAREHFQRGYDLYQQGLYPGAKAELERAKQLGLHNADLEYGFAQLASMIGGQLSPEERKMRRAELQAEVEQHLQEALKLDPNHVPSLMMMAEVCDGGFPVRHLEALQYLERVLAIHSDMDQVRLEAGRKYQSRPLRIAELALGKNGIPQPLTASLQLDLARQHLEKVIQHADPNSEMAARAHLDMAWVLVKMADFERGMSQALLAEKVFSALGGHEQELRMCWFRAGVAAVRRRDFKAAFAYLPKAIDDPHMKWAALWNMKLAADRGGGYPAGFPAALRIRIRPELISSPGPGEPPFVNIAQQVGVAKTAGAAATGWTDSDGSGKLSLFVSGCNTFSNLYRFDGKRFTDETETSGLANVDWGFSANWIDYDNDGFDDLFIGRNGWAGAGPHSLLHNDGHGRFTDVTKQAGVECLTGSTYVSLATDFDRDGFVDLFLCNGVTGDGSPNVLMHNNRNGTFSDWTERCGLKEDRFLGNGTLAGAIGDYDGDGWPDLFLVGANAPNRLFHNRGNGTFEDVTERAGVGGPTKVMGYQGFMADFNSDGRLDLLTVTLAPWDIAIRGLIEGGTLTPEEMNWTPRLYLNNGDGTFRDMSIKCGMKWPVGCMGANIGDLDNDGAIDIVFGTGDPNPERWEPTRVFRNRGDATFEDVSWKWGLTGNGKGHGITVADYDADGRLDIYAPYGGFFHCDETPAMLFHNRLPYRPSLWVKCIGTKSNRNAIGARLTLTAGGRTLVREVTGPTGFGSTNLQWVHFGLGSAKIIDTLDVRWPSGTTERINAIAADSRITVTEGRGITARQPLNKPWQP